MRIFQDVHKLAIYRIIFYLDMALLTACLVVACINGINGDAFGEGKQAVVFAVTTPLVVMFTIGGAITIKAIRDYKAFLNSLRVENKYALGEESTFFDIHAFKSKVSTLHKSKFLAKRKRFLIAFSISTMKIAINSFHNEQVTHINYEVSKYIASLFKGTGDYSKRYDVYAYNQGVFLVYLAIKEEDIVLELIDKLTSFIYNIAEERNVHVSMQPFFGVKEMHEEDSVSEAIEDAMSARNTSESSFANYTYFDDKERVIDSADELISIKEGLEKGQFLPYYQLKYSLKEKRFISAEALARWNHPVRGIITPSQFIDKAERGGYISAIDVYIFEAALKDISLSLKKGRRVLPISCNFSLYEFFSHDFLNQIVSLLKKYQVPPSLVEIEITETTSQSNKFLSVSVIKKLKDIGIRVLMDDFGVGYSGLETLRAIPFDAIKIDKSFVDHMFDDEKTKSIIKFLVELGHSNDIEVITEGVETKEQVEALRRMHIDTIQGFYYSRPLSYADMEAMLKENDFEGRKTR